MPNSTDLSAVDPIVDDRLDALEAGGGGGGGPSGIGHEADYGNFSTPIAVAASGAHAYLAADYEEGSFTPAEDNLVPAMDTDGTITFETATAAIVYLYASAVFDSAPPDGELALLVSVNGTTQPIETNGTDGTGDGSQTALSAEVTAICMFRAGATLGPVVVTNQSAIDFDVTGVELNIKLLS